MGDFAEKAILHHEELADLVKLLALTSLITHSCNLVSFIFHASESSFSAIIKIIQFTSHAVDKFPPSRFL
jgi:hypothetical protein